MSLNILSYRNIHIVVTSLVFTLLVTSSITAHAQALEEIVVTAQRRTQSLQDVPIAIEAISGEEIQRQGFRDLRDMGEFTPTVIIEQEQLQPSVSVRGLGTATTDAFTVEQSSAFFVDGIHYARTSMNKLAFLDVAQVEILKGPQPVYFGQNAIAGAFNIRSRRPTPEWEGYAQMDIGRFGAQTYEAAAGGPISDTFRIRVAGKHDRYAGYLRDIVSNARFPEYKNNTARVMVDWQVSDNLKASAKLEMADLFTSSEGGYMCARPEDQITDTTEFFDGWDGVYFEPPIGVGSNGVPLQPLPSCDDKSGNIGRSQDGPFFAPPGTYLDSGRYIAVDIRDAGNEVFQELYGVNMTDGFEKLKPKVGTLELNYELGNGIVLSSLSSAMHYNRITNRENRGALAMHNVQYRDHDHVALSQEFRASSPDGLDWEWMAGVYVQDIDEDSITELWRGNTNEPRRIKHFDATGNWRAAFANIGYNGLMDGKLGISVGGRWMHVKKVTAIWGEGATYILEDVDNPGETITFPFVHRTPGVWNNIDSPYNGAKVIGLSELRPLDEIQPSVYGVYDGIKAPKGIWTGTRVDPQIVVAYKPTGNHSFYAKYVESFKAGGADGSLATIDDDRETFEFDEENATHWELGAKGNFLDNRVRYDISAFDTTIDDLQIGSTQTDPNVGAQVRFGNFAKQNVRGIEFGANYAATERLTLGLTGAFIDNTFVEFVGGCTDYEEDHPEESGCVVETGLIDRAGQRATNSPEWKFVLSSNYEMPVWDNYKLSFNAKGYLSAGYITNAGFSLTNKMDTHGDLNLQMGFGDYDNSWRLSVYGRNLMEVRSSFHPEYASNISRLSGGGVKSSSFRNYGVKLRFNFR